MSINVKTDSTNEKDAYKARLEAMTDEQLAAESEQKIWLSAYASNNARSAYHWQCDMTYDEAVRRGKPTIYSEAHARASGKR